MGTWSAPVRYAEIDGQGVVFNAHYLTYCDEAMSQYCRDRELGNFAADVQLVTSTITWTSGARWGETVAVEVACTRVGTSSFVLAFAITADGRPCCAVDTTYVHIGADGRARPIPEKVRRSLS